MERVDLFDRWDLQPPALEEIAARMSIKQMAEGLTYDDLEVFKSEVEGIGYTFDYGLDAVPYDLRPL